jgi:hypothetical protein
MPEPVSIGSTLKAAIELVASVWKNGALLLWSCAVAAAAVFVVLFASKRLGIDQAADLENSYGIYLLVAGAALAVFAVFKTYAEHRIRPIVLIADEQRSHWSRATQQNGQIFTAFALDFQAINISNHTVQLAKVRLCWPWVSTKHVVQTLLMVQHPEQNVHGRFPILAHQQTHCSAHITIDKPL